MSENETPPEVRRILASVREEHRPDIEGREEAGRRLLQAFEASFAEVPGVWCRYDNRTGAWEAGVECMPAATVGFGVSPRPEDPGIFMWRIRDGRRGDESILVEGLEFDGLSKSYVGADPDPELAPIPGQPYTRKNALRVMAEAFQKMMKDAPLTILEACAQREKMSQ